MTEKKNSQRYWLVNIRGSGEHRTDKIDKKDNDHLIHE